tara:strand:- start:65 stop:487 length:423 start_codon:yes stop_codon:yes gene_type:complete
MLNFLKKKAKVHNNDKIILVCGLLVHAAKMDENYSEKEKKIILQALKEIYKKKDDELKLILLEAEKKENESNQILEFTKEIKNYDKNFRLKIIKILWHIIYSDGVSDIYESNLMRRLSALLYITDKENGNIKLEVANNFK